MKVLFFSHSAGLGGAERSLLALIDELSSMRVECAVVLPHTGPLHEALEKRNVSLFLIPFGWWCAQESLTDTQIRQRYLYSLSHLIQARKKLDAWNADIVFTNSITIPWGAIYSALSRKPHVLHIREFGQLDFTFRFFAGYEASVEFLAQSSSAVITNSQATYKHFKALLPKTQITVAYPTVHLETSSDDQAALAFENPHALKLLVSGTLTEGKGQLDAVQATAILREYNVQAELLLLGNTGDTAYVEKLQQEIKALGLENQVRVLGYSNDPLQVMEQADIVLVCSRNEAFGRVTLEAMALYKVLICANSGGTQELISDGENGHLYEPGNPRQLANKVLHVVKHPEHLLPMRYKARQTYLKIQAQGQYGRRTLKTLFKASIFATLQPVEEQAQLVSNTAWKLLGLPSFSTQKSWAELERMVPAQKVLMLLNPQVLTEKITQRVSRS